MRRSLALAPFVLALALALAAQAQSRVAATPDPTGTVTGHVFCSDTNQPARFARVSLQAIPASGKSKTPSDPALHSADTSGAGKVETGIDGSFTLAHVKPGNYYVVVGKAGYLGAQDLFTPEQMKDTSPDMLARRAAAMTTVTVEADHTEAAEVRLERGAVVSGTVLYDDGTPASGLNMRLLHKNASGKWIASEFNGSLNSWVTTNDLGNFRAISLLPGDYIVEADLSLASSNTQHMKMAGGIDLQIDVQTFHYSLPFYGTGTAHLTEAKPVALRAGIEVPGQDMTIPISKLHKLTGRVAAGRDGHFVNEAKLSLVSRDDNKEIATTDISREDGLFHFEFVPDGDYTLKITDARDVTWSMPASTPNNPMPKEVERTVASYGNTEEPILLRGDQLDTLATVSPDNGPTTPGTASPNTGANASTGSQPEAPADPKQQAAPGKPEAAPQTKSSVASLL